MSDRIVYAVDDIPAIRAAMERIAAERKSIKIPTATKAILSADTNIIGFTLDWIAHPVIRNSTYWHATDHENAMMYVTELAGIPPNAFMPYAFFDIIDWCVEFSDRHMNSVAKQPYLSPNCGLTREGYINNNVLRVLARLKKLDMLEVTT